MPSFYVFLLHHSVRTAVITPVALEAEEFKIGGDDLWRQPSANETENVSQMGFKTEISHGNTVVNLERPGPVYFVSGDPDHCKNGQRLTVEVVTPHRSPPQLYMDASPAPAPFSSAGSFSIVQKLVFLYVFVTAVSINM
ncbi:hypothetical protein CDL12_03089 [Handroanthus impetiginosus]|uniref:Phytocyanin domain-containing protein n=1 Tax=Handroanthus impetiginosus TaxID=429701 RepID=A0A2G9I346_9LAMI|nr:hypothetical protein CDL12_03089 [Handroanthus impetiginosus]